MRKENWVNCLNETLEDWADMPFIWGETDCFHFAVACINAMTGSKIAEGIACGYTTFIGSMRQLKKEYGVKGLAEFANTMFDHIDIKMAGRGDLVLYQGALGICNGQKSAFMTEADGLIYVNTVQCTDAWRVS